MDKWVNMLDMDRLHTVLTVLRGFRQQYEIVPLPKHVFKMFGMISPNMVKVVFIGQSPYPGICYATGVPYACGPAFMPNPLCATTPVTLRKILAELCRDLGIQTLMVPPTELLDDWVKQGVMLLNASLTLGAGGCPRHLEDHSVLWKEVICTLVQNLSLHCSPIFVLIGKHAWELERCIAAGCPVVKVYHPAARNDMFMGCGVFSKVSKAMVERGDVPIRWHRF